MGCLPGEQGIPRYCVLCSQTAPDSIDQFVVCDLAGNGSIISPFSALVLLGNSHSPASPNVITSS